MFLQLGDQLKHKIQQRPDRDALVQQHILEGTAPPVTSSSPGVASVPHPFLKVPNERPSHCNAHILTQKEEKETLKARCQHIWISLPGKQIALLDSQMVLALSMPVHLLAFRVRIIDTHTDKLC